MCEYCGCQEVPALAVLTAEHDAIVNVIGQIRTAIEARQIDVAAERCRQILLVLGPHVQVEEQGLFPPMRAEFPDQIEALSGEHRSIEAVLLEAGHATPTDPQWPVRLLAALHALREHILKEQDGLFPASLATLRPEDWDLIEALRTNTPAELSGKDAGHSADHATRLNAREGTHSHE